MSIKNPCKDCIQKGTMSCNQQLCLRFNLYKNGSKFGFKGYDGMSQSHNNLILHKNPENCTATFPCYHPCYKCCVWNKGFLSSIGVSSSSNDSTSTNKGSI